MSEPIRIAAVQMRPELGANERNLAAIERWTGKAIDAGAKLILFPEAALQGIVFPAVVSAAAASEQRDGPAIERIAELARANDAAIVFGFLERLGNGIANTAAICFPDREPAFYRKTHLTRLGADRWVLPGESLCEVQSFEGLRFGVIICYDIRFPEVGRALALEGVDALLMPTNSPVGYEGTYDHAARTRAWENRVWVVVSNRVGEEGNATFIGRSLACDPFGNVVCQVGGQDEELLFVDVDVDLARSKLLSGSEGEEYDFLACRRPDLYRPLVDDRLAGPQ